MSAVLENILITVQSEIQGLNLTDIADDHVHIQKVPTTSNFVSNDFPAILITPMGVPKINPSAGTNLRDQIEYPIGVFMVDSDNQNQTLNRNKYLEWYEAVVKKFRIPSLTGVDEVVSGYVTTGTVVDQDWFVVGEYRAGITLWFISWETR